MDPQGSASHQSAAFLPSRPQELRLNMNNPSIHLHDDHLDSSKTQALMNGGEVLTVPRSSRSLDGEIEIETDMMKKATPTTEPVSTAPPNSATSTTGTGTTTSAPGRNSTRGQTAGGVKYVHRSPCDSSESSTQTFSSPPAASPSPASAPQSNADHRQSPLAAAWGHQRAAPSEREGYDRERPSPVQRFTGDRAEPSTRSFSSVSSFYSSDLSSLATTGTHHVTTPPSPLPGQPSHRGSERALPTVDRRVNLTDHSALYTPTSPRATNPGDYAGRLDLTTHVVSTAAHPQERSDISQNLSNPIEIVFNPLDCTVVVGERAVFNCKARIVDSPKTELNLLWYWNEEPLVGEINCEFVVEHAREENEGYYFCLVTDLKERFSRRSRNARLLVRKKGPDSPEINPKASGDQTMVAPEVISQPKTYVEGIIGERLRLVVTATGTPPLAYKWYKDTRELAYVRSNILELPSVNSGDSGRYCCAISNTCGSILTDTYVVKAKRRSPPPAATSHQKSLLSFTKSLDVTHYSSPPTREISADRLSAADQQPVTDRFLKQVSEHVARQTTNWSRLALFLGVSNSEVIKFRMHYYRPEDQAFQLLRAWRENRTPSSATPPILQAILKQAGVSLSSSQPQYHGAMPVIVAHPDDCEVVYGQTARLVVHLQRLDSTTRFQWFRNDQQLRGKNSADLVISSAIDEDAGSYFCRVTNLAGPTDSNRASITIRDIHPVSHVRRPVRANSFHLVHTHSHSQDSQRHYLSGFARGEEYTSERPTSLPEHPGTPTSSPVDGSLEKPTIVEQPVSHDVEPGDPMTLKCLASGPGTISYQWFFNGRSLRDEASPQYSINSFTDEDEGLYSCEVSNGSGRVMSHLAHVAMKLD